MGFARGGEVTTTDTSADTSMSSYGTGRRGFLMSPETLQIRKHAGDSDLSVRKEEVAEVTAV